MNPTDTELRRARECFQLAREVLPHVFDLPSMDLTRDWVFAQQANSESTREQFLARLMERAGEHRQEWLIDFFVFSAATEVPKEDREGTCAKIAARSAIGAWLREQRPDSAATKLSRRLVHMLSQPIEGIELPPPQYQGSTFEERYSASPQEVWLEPKPQECADILERYSVSQALLEFSEELLEGKFDTPTPTLRAATSSRLLAPYIRGLIQRALEWTMAAGQLERRLFDRAVDVWGSAVIPYDWNSPEDWSEPTGAQIATLARMHAKALVAAFPDNQEKVLGERWLYDVDSMHGAHWFFDGCALIERLNLTAKDLTKDVYVDKSVRLVRSLLNVKALDADESLEAVTSRLEAVTRETLLIALPYAGVLRVPILEVLGWQDTLPLYHTLFGIGSPSGWKASQTRFDDIPNSTDSRQGVVDRKAVEAAIAAASPPHRKAFIACFKQSALGFKNSLMMIEAVLGTNRAALEKSIARSGQVAIKAFGLLPVESEEELLQRYLTLQRCFKEAKKFGSERQANTQAAAKAGLANLAQSAGFADATRLEWKMEGHLATEALALQEPQQIEDWHVRLDIDEGGARIEVSKNGKILKSIPPALRKTPVYLQMKERQATLTEQARRFRRALEDMMCRGERIPTQDLQSLLKLPLVRAMLERLILVAEDGELGLFDADAMCLRGLNAIDHSTSGRLRIAHSCDLLSAGQLSAWQALIVKRRIVQPFKQAFREIYVVTPAEAETRSFSNRFAGHAVRGAVASRLLQSRNWRLTSGDDASVFKVYPEQGVVANFNFADAGHFLAENEHVVTDSLQFRSKGERIAMTDVPPLVFSETMRDADLVVSVAHVEPENASWSTEGLAARAALIESLASELGLDRVRTEGHFAYVRGHLASYRIHLGSAAVHIDPGNYLCIVPKDVGPTSFYLPFADEDRKTSEVLSKIFLLLEDKKIKDESIVQQISRATVSAQSA